MKKLRNKDALRRLAESDRRAVEARKVLESRIEEAMDRWAAQIERMGPFTPADAWEMLGYRANRVRAGYGVVLV